MGNAFAEVFGVPPALSAEAPGRVNLIGEHTDSSGGFVLPMAIPQRTRVEIRPRSDVTVRVCSAEMARGTLESFALGEESPCGTWVDYVQGVTWAARAAGHALGGFDARVTSGVPVGSGLSSSAALEVALFRALRSAFALQLDDLALALLAQKAEVEFVGAPVGMMDPVACSLAGTDAALFLDTRSLRTERVPLPAGLAVGVIHSGITHRHADGEYRTRRAECEAAARALGVAQLRDLGPEDLERVDALAPPLDRRARHVVTENARVVAAVQAMRAGDSERLGTLLDASHASLRDDFQVSVPDLDLMVALAQADSGVLGARMTGGGFGGAIVLLAWEAGIAAAVSRVAAAYARRSGRTPLVLMPVR